LFDSRFDGAIIGLGYIGANLPIAIYSKKQLIEQLAKLNMSHDEITEYYSGHFTAALSSTFAPVIFDDTLGD
jgi:hypothetical protein